MIEGAVTVTMSGTVIPFPATESLWKTTDGGKSWKRILVSGLELSVDNKEIKIGSLESIILSPKTIPCLCISAVLSHWYGFQMTEEPLL